MKHDIVLIGDLNCKKLRKQNDRNPVKMDSKYSIFAKKKLFAGDSNSFNQGFKRKFSYGSGAPPAKKPNLQHTPRLSNPSSKANSVASSYSSTADRSTVQDIQSQRQKLPVFAVREQ